MAKNLKKFSTEAEYSAATLNYPAVSWIVSGDTVNFDNVPASTEKVVFTYGSDNLYVYLYDEDSSPSSITSVTLINDGDNWKVELDMSTIQPTLNSIGVQGDDMKIEYGIEGNTIDNCFGGNLGCDEGYNWEFLIPSQITTIKAFPSNYLKSLVIKCPTMPSFEVDWSSEPLHLDTEAECGIYVPDALVNTYKISAGWISFAEYIYPISQYSGNLPV